MKIFTLLKCSVLLLALQAQADTLVGKVIHVADGDTLTVLDHAQTQHKIRLAGIDAPESKQAFGQVSKQSLADHVAGEVVEVEWDKMDRYGRKVGKVLLGGQDANLRQIQRGLAWLGITRPMNKNRHHLTAKPMPLLRTKLRPPNWVYGRMLRLSLRGSFGAINNACAMNFS